MTDTRTPEERVLAWIDSGPAAANPEFIDRTLRPIPRMRQRRSWHVALERLSPPLARPLALVLAALLLIGLLFATVVAPGGVPAPTGPTFQLSIAHSDPGGSIPDTGPFVTDPTATTNTCQHLSDGFWKIDYSGGDPYVRMLLLIGPEAAADGRSEDVSAEIIIGSPLSTLLNFDQPGHRSGDAPGRSTAVVETTTGADAITFDIAATTPRWRFDFSDYPYTVDVDLTVVCPT